MGHCLIILIILSFLAILLEESEAIQAVGRRSKDLPMLRCYGCSTYSDKDIDCFTSRDQEPDECGEGENVCFKIVTYDNKVTKESNMDVINVARETTKGCGRSWWKGCQTRVSNGGKQVLCHCDEFGCNAAHVSTQTSVLLVSFLAFIYTICV